MKSTNVDEGSKRRGVVKELVKLHAVPVENGDTSPGTPDVAYLAGWLELKYVRKKPKRKTTPVRVSHYTQEQRVWATKHRHLGGSCDMLIFIESSVLLIDGAIAAKILGHVPFEELVENSINYWPNGYRKGELLCALTDLWIVRQPLLKANYDTFNANVWGTLSPAKPKRGA